MSSGDVRDFWTASRYQVNLFGWEGASDNRNVSYGGRAGVSRVNVILGERADGGEGRRYRYVARVSQPPKFANVA